MNTQSVFARILSRAASHLLLWVPILREAHGHLVRQCGTCAILCLLQCLFLTASVQSAPQQSGGNASNRKSDTQTADDPALQPILTPEAAGRPGTEPEIGDVIWLFDQDGKPVKYLWTARTKEFLDWLKQRTKLPETLLPSHSVTKVMLKGTVDDSERTAVLKATIRIQVNRGDQAVLVPLKMNESTLLDHEYHGDGIASFDDFDREAGYQCWLQGKGQHELRLTLSVRIRKQLPNRRMQLELPYTIVRDLQLDVPLARISVDASERTTVKTSLVAPSHTRIEMHGIGQRLDIAWKPLPVPKKVQTELQATTLIMAELSASSVVLEATQTIRALQGSFDTVIVRLPAGFELFDLEEREFQVDPADPNRVTVSLPEPTVGPVELVWTLYSGDSDRTNKITAFEGFDVEQARRQMGYLAISHAEGYRVSKREETARFVHRISVSELRTFNRFRPPIGPGQVTSAYRFFEQPFRLEFQIEEIEPYFTVRPRAYLKLAVDRADLEANFELQVFRGTVPEIELLWPSMTREGWVIEQPALETDRASGVHVLEYSERQKGTFHVQLRAHRAIETATGAFNISLPRIKSVHQFPPILVVAQAENVETDEFTPTDETAIRPLVGRLRQSVQLPAELQQLQCSFFQIESSQQNFLAKVTQHEQLISTDTSIVARLNGRRLEIKQSVRYSVQYEPVSQVHLRIPKELAGFVDQGGIQYFFQDDAPLVPTETDAGDDFDLSRYVRLELREPRIGPFAIRIEFDVDLSDSPFPNALDLIGVPVVNCGDADFSSCSFEFLLNDESLNAEAYIDDETWKQQLRSNNETVWRTDGPRTTVPLSIRPSTTDEFRDYAIPDSVVRTSIDHTGLARSQATYSLDGKTTSFDISFPPGAEVTVNYIKWGDRELQPSRIEELSSTRYHIDVPPLPAGKKRELSIEFDTKSSTGSGLGDQHRLIAPEFPPEIRFSRMSWEVVLPSDQYLLTYPSSVSPQFAWQRRLFFWSRISIEARGGHDDWATASIATSDRNSGFKGNSYRFTSFGPPNELVFRTMNSAGILLLGAGMSLLLGILLLRIPATRHFLTFLGLGFIVSVAGVWYLEAVQLLLQPAILGLILAGIAAWIERAIQRSRGAEVAGMSSPSDFLSIDSTIDRTGSGVVSADDSTTLRPPSQPAAAEPIAASDLGSEV